jgi:hypothetical protein
LYRLDGFGEPSFAVKKEKQDFSKNTILSGDTLALKNKSDVGIDDLLILKINISYTGLPDDCNYIGEIKANKEYSLDDLKQ